MQTDEQRNSSRSFCKESQHESLEVRQALHRLSRTHSDSLISLNWRWMLFRGTPVENCSSVADFVDC